MDDTIGTATTARKLFNKDFILLWQGQFVSQMGNQVHAIAMMFWIKHATGSASLMGLLMMLAMLPGVLLGPIGGTFADRHSRRKIIIVADVLRGIAVLALAAMLFLLPEEVDAAIVWLCVATVLIGVLGAFFRPAISAAIPDIVPSDKLASANSLNQSSVQIAVLLGQGVGGWLFRVLGAPVLFLIDGITYLVSAFTEMFIDIPQHIPEKSSGLSETVRKFKADTVEGFRYIWRRRGLRMMFMTAAVLNLFSAPLMVLLPFYVEDHLHATPDWYGFLVAGFGLGGLAGYIFAGGVKMHGRMRAIATAGSLVLVGLMFSLLAVVDTTGPTLVITLITGALSGVFNINVMTILQATTASEIRGRVFGLLGTLSAGLMPVGMGLAGVVADLTGQRIPLIFGVCGLVVAGVSALAACSHDYREFLAIEAETNKQN